MDQWQVTISLGSRHANHCTDRDFYRGYAVQHELLGIVKEWARRLPFVGTGKLGGFDDGV
jgi:hypothetical protein